MDLERSAMRFDERSEGIVVARPRSFEQPGGPLDLGRGDRHTGEL